MTAFFGRNAKLVSPDYGSPIHIIMDRSTGKTNDCYVEFFSTGDAQAAVNRLLFRGHQLKLGTAPNDRIVTVEVSSQDVLLKELFPRAKNVSWKDGKPVVEDTNEPFNTGFKAFITGEEMVMLVRHAEQPHRVSDPNCLHGLCQSSECSLLSALHSSLFFPTLTFLTSKLPYCLRKPTSYRNMLMLPSYFKSGTLCRRGFPSLSL